MTATLLNPTFYAISDGGGGGERVLWVAVRALLKDSSSTIWHVVIYAGDEGTVTRGYSQATVLSNVEVARYIY